MERRRWSRAGGAIVVGAVAIAIGAQVSVPMVPVPTTLQTLAVVAIGLLAGPRVGAGAPLLYLLGVLAGLPILSSGQQYGGWSFLEFAAAGYVVGFVPAGAVAGLLGRGGWLRATGAGLAGHGVVFAIGVPVLAGWIGLEAALTKGLWPFVPGAVVKSVAAAVLWVGVERSRRRGA